MKQALSVDIHHFFTHAKQLKNSDTIVTEGISSQNHPEKKPELAGDKCCQSEKVTPLTPLRCSRATAWPELPAILCTPCNRVAVHLDMDSSVVLRDGIWGQGPGGRTCPPFSFFTALGLSRTCPPPAPILCPGSLQILGRAHISGLSFRASSHCPRRTRQTRVADFVTRPALAFAGGILESAYDRLDQELNGRRTVHPTLAPA